MNIFTVDPESIPGCSPRQDLARNYLSVMSLADVAVLVVSAAQGAIGEATEGGVLSDVSAP